VYGVNLSLARKLRADYLRKLRVAAQCKSFCLPASLQFARPKIGYDFETPFFDVKK
jgi:hypothetical protein